MIEGFVNAVVGIIQESGFLSSDWRNYVMIGIACVLLYLAIARQFEPLLLLPIAFGMLLVNVYPAIMAEPTETANGGLFYYLYQGVKLGIYPPLIFLGVGAMTDFGPLIARPSSFLLGAAAQLGIFLTFLGALALGFTPQQSGAIGIIGGADGPTAIYVTSRLAPELLGPIAVAFLAEGLSEKEAARKAKKKAIEDARFVLPNACTTKMICTMNAQKACAISLRSAAATVRNGKFVMWPSRCFAW